MRYIAKLILDIFDYFTLEKIYEVLKKNLGKDLECLIDVGSHKGEYINKSVKEFNVKKIYGFEANPNTFKILVHNVEKLNNVIVKNFGIGYERKKINLYENIESSSSSFNDLNRNSKYYKKKYFFLNFFGSKKITSPILVDIIRLEDFLHDENLKKIDLLKIDTEGFEFNVLRGIGAKIDCINLIHLEHHFDDMIIKDYTLTDIHNYLKSKGFKKIFKIKMKFRKSFEYIYQNQSTR
tara:strand:+ start:2857 stop:3567 length:711 start_codon:yes stop_codon:yes gene_type:complete